MTECGTVLFHATRKENLKNIMKEGLKPGGGQGWCEAFGKSFPREELESCKKFVHLSGRLDILETEELGDIGLDRVIIACVQPEKLLVRGKSFQQWNSKRNKSRTYDISSDTMKSEVLSDLFEVRTLDTIPPENIIGCLDVKESTRIGNLGKYKINKECK